MKSYFILKKQFLIFFLIFFTGTLIAQNRQKISGVISSEGETLIGASVVEKNTKQGTVTDMNGNYVLEVYKDAVLIISYIGFKTKEVKVGNQTRIDIILQSETNLLNDVVVVGYGVLKKKLITGATVQVKGDQISSQNTVSVINALQGLTPGVNITKLNGKPGESSRVTIRGMGTIGDSAPLYVIDGITGGDINMLNPSDIESVDVLKDAASAAIYGSRAANGVILITTKHGKAGKTSISYDGYYGWQNINKNVNVLGAKDYLDMMQEQGILKADKVTADNIPMLEKIQSGKWNGTNWLNELVQNNAPMQNHALNISRGNEDSSFSFGFSYTSQEPNIAAVDKETGSGFDRYTLRLNSEHTLIKLSNKSLLKFGESLFINHSSRRGLGVATGNIYWNDIRRSFTSSPLFPAYNDNGSYSYPLYQLNSHEMNPLADIYYNRSMQGSKNYASIGNFYFILEPVKDLKLRSSFGYDYSSFSSRSYIPAFENGIDSRRDYDMVSQQGGSGLSWQLENVLTYDFNIAKGHKFTALLGSTLERTGLGENISGSNQNVEFDDFFHAYLSNAKIVTNGMTSLSGSSYGENSLTSFFGRLNYDYRNKYMATVILRTDGSSKFAKGNRWGYFPSVSAGWNVMEESFMENAKSYLDYLKVRASFGENGNNRIPDFRYASTIDLGTLSNLGWYYFGDVKNNQSIGSFVGHIPNLELKWETSRQTDIGVDMALINSRLVVNFDWYNKKTVDWLVLPNSLGIWGTGAPYVNGGDVVNQGVELMLNWNDKIGDFKYSISGNMGYNKNEVVKIANADHYINGASNVLGNGIESFYRAELGKPIGYFIGYKTNGIFQNQDEINNFVNPKTGGLIMPAAKPGDVIFQDLNKDGKITVDDRTEIGNPHPDFNYGINLSFQYIGFDFSAVGYGVAGNQIIKSYRENGTPSWANYTTDMLGRWHGEGTSNRLPALNGTAINWQYVSDLYIENGDYFRITNITMGYDFKKIFKSLPLLQVRIYASAQNLLTFTNYTGLDPEVSGSGSGADAWTSGIDIGNYPSARTYMIGVSIKY